MEGVLSPAAVTYRAASPRLASYSARVLGAEAPPLPYAFTEADFARIRGLIYRKAGISLSPGKMDMVYSRLARRLRVRELDSFAEYLRLLEAGDEEELEAFINALTTNMTSFFREPHHFRILGEKLARQGSRPISIWSCACSTGEEPYSIALTALQAFRTPPPVRILATDIDTTVLAKAREGIYTLEQLQKVPAELVGRGFLRGSGSREGLARVKDELKQMVSFKRLNLLDARWPMRERFDYIFCRNVMIYFDKETQRGVLDRLAESLKPDGLLFIGHSESLHSEHGHFRSCGNTIYRLKAKG